MRLEIAVIAIAAIAVLSIGIASAHEPVQNTNQMTGSMGTHNMMRGMYASNMMQSSSMHDKGSMRDMMKSHHADLTDEEINEMMKNCPMHKE